MDGTIAVLMIPFLGTTAGAACVFLMRHRMQPGVQKSLMGFAAGIMVAASVWSLLIPSMEMTGKDGFAKVLPAIAGFALGILFLLFLDVAVPHQHIDGAESEGPKSRLSKTAKLVFAVTLHNIPEGMAVGVTLAAALEHSSYISMAVPRHSHTELSRGSDSFDASQVGRQQPTQVLHNRHSERGCGTRCRRHHTASGILCPAGAAISFIFCCRRHDVCRGRRTYSGNAGRPSLELWHDRFRRRFLPDDGPRRTVRIEKF